MKKSIDIPKCFKCAALLDISSDFESMRVSELSGATQEFACPECGVIQNVSPSIEWHSWSVQSLTITTPTKRKDGEG